mgnify:FL=1
MKIVFNRQEIINCVTPLMCAASGSRSSIAAVEGILFEAEAPSTVTMTTYDLEKGVRTTVEANVLEGGSCVINAQKFLQSVKVMSGDEITLSVNDRLAVSIMSGKSNYRMSALPAADFPALPALRTELGFTLPSGVLRKMINKVSYAMGVNDQRIILNGTYFKVNDGDLLCVACDSFRLAKSEKKLEFGRINDDRDALHFAYVVPAKTINELCRMLPDDDELTVAVYMGRKHMVYVIEGLTFFTRLIEGEYIDYDRIIIKNHRIIVECPREALLMALEKAAIVTEEKIVGAGRAYVKLSLEGGLLKVTAESALGSSYDEILVEHEGEDIVIAFNNRYLIDSVRSCTGDTVELQMSTPLTSVNIIPVHPDDGEDTEDVFFLLPVRMQN